MSEQKAARLASGLYRGRVRHRRVGPRPHAFQARFFLVYLDLDELEHVFRGRWLWSTRRPAPLWFRRADYLGDARVPLGQAVAQRVEDELGFRPRGPVRVLTQLRTWGYAFNPVSFYYCFAADGETLEAVVAEITNTPWNERHAYVLDARTAARAGRLHTWRFPKAFHVSPFFALEHDYVWRFRVPGQRLLVRMENHPHAGGGRAFDATLVLRREELTGGAMARALLAHPWTTLLTSLAIYWQAFRLWRKRTPFFVHPKKRALASAGASVSENLR